MAAIIAIDPGLSGGIAWGDDPWNPSTARMPDDLENEIGMIALHQLLVNIRSQFPNIRAVVELVGGYVGEAQPASSAFKFGGADSAARMGLVGAGITNIARPAPVSWQRHLDLPRRPRTAKGKAAHKRDLKDLAVKLFPRNKVTLKTADALLLYHLAHRGLV